MKYRSFYIFICKDGEIRRENKDGEIIIRSGFRYLVCADSEGEILIDSFSGALGFELPDSSPESAEMFGREMVDIQYKEYCKARDEETI